mmetsp:Transcript_8984/g.35177  ORF Transcript_8984/g.35177 Transcript_8984/m.35177 type:complete len:426 (+) Transcript_8984:490-1767(+)
MDNLSAAQQPLTRGFAPQHRTESVRDLKNEFVILFFIGHERVHSLHQSAVNDVLRVELAHNGTDEHDRLQRHVIVHLAGREQDGGVFQQAVFLARLRYVQGVAVQVGQSAQNLHHEIAARFLLLHQPYEVHDVRGEVASGVVARARDVSYHLKRERIPQPNPSAYQRVKAPLSFGTRDDVLAHNLCALRVRRDVHGESDELRGSVQVLHLKDEVQEDLRRGCVREHAAGSGVHRDVVQERHGHVLKVRVPHQVNHARDQRPLHHGFSHVLVEGEVQQQPQRDEEQYVLARDEPRQFIHDGALLHGVFVLPVHAELLQERHAQHEQVHASALERLAQVHRYVPLLHLSLDARVLRQVEEHVEAHVQQPVLFPLRERQTPLGELVQLALLLDRLEPVVVSLRLEVDDSHRRVPHLVLQDRRVELAVV